MFIATALVWFVALVIRVGPSIGSLQKDKRDRWLLTLIGWV